MFGRDLSSSSSSMLLNNAEVFSLIVGFCLEVICRGELLCRHEGKSGEKKAEQLSQRMEKASGSNTFRGDDSVGVIVKDNCMLCYFYGLVAEPI